MPETRPAARSAAGVDRLAARAAAWGTACLRGEASPDLAGERIAGAGLPQRVAGAGEGAVHESWPLVLARWSARGVTGLRLALPAPGDVAGVPGPPSVAAAALRAGAALIPVGGPHLVLVPEPGRALIEWRGLPCDAPTAPVSLLHEADRVLRAAVRESAEALASLEVSRWSDAGGEVIAAMRSGSLDGDALPACYPARAREALVRARRLRAVCAAALADEGGAVGLADSASRREVLRALDRAARVTEMAACNVLLEPEPRDGAPDRVGPL
jgi:hypothetical protein